MAPIKTFLAASLAGLSFASPILERQLVTVTEVVTAPAPSATSWNDGAVSEFPIHSSCNATERAQLEDGFRDMITLVDHAKQHILRWGNQSAHYQRWFGDAPTNGPIGWYERILSADRSGMLFRCDDIDGNCAHFPTYAGHWRGNNATQETVICPRSFTGIRWPLTAMCSRGYTVAGSKGNNFFGTDLIHRVLHVPRISEGLVDHYGENLKEWLETAQTNPENAVVNSDTLQLFAVDVYGYDITLPGVGCFGEVPDPATSSAAAASSAASSAVSSAAPSSAAAVTSEAPLPTQTSSNCHSHADGTLHCT